MTTAVAERPRVVQHTFEPRGAAVKLFQHRGDEVLLSGPAGTGKSRAALEKCHMMALLNPGCRGLFVRKTQRSLASTGLVTFREKVATEGIRHGVLKWFGGSTQEPPGYRYANGSFIAVGGMDDPTKIMSSEYDFIYVQEATEFTPNDWEACTTRLRNGRISFQQLLADCNPSHPTHWLKVRADGGQLLMLNSTHEDNPLYFNRVVAPDGTERYELTEAGRAYIVGKLDKLSGVRYLRLRKGIWAAAEGVVYEDFDENHHLVDALPPGSETWTRYWSIDFGYSNPFVCQWWAEDPDGRLWLYREIYMSRRLVEDHARQILSQVRAPKPGLGRRPVHEHDGDWVWTEPRPQAIICDHDAEDRATLERHLGMSTIAARKAPKAGDKGLVGLQDTQKRYEIQPDGKPRILFVRHCTVERDQVLVDAGLPASTVEEIPGYVWPQDVAPDKREHPVKKDDHGMDGKRYVVGYVDITNSGHFAIRSM